MKNRFHNPAICSKPEEIIATIRLSRSNNIGPITFLKLIDKYELPSEALRGAEEILKKREQKLISEKDAEKEIAAAEKNGAKIITIFDEFYPALLAEISDPPILLSVKGNYKKISENAIAFVGARYSSANAISLSFKLANEVAAKNVYVVSGLARGIDTAAHKGALKNSIELSTIAVIAGGIDNIYPPENAELYNEIAERGVVMSENTFGMVPKAEHFPRRNRIISGLSQITCVIEAALKSGSLITARFALEQNREVAAVPGFPLDPRSEGTNMLLKKGAHMVTNSSDLSELLKNYHMNRVKDFSGFKENDFDPDFISEGESKIDLLEILSSTPITLDELIAIYDLNPAEINAKLLEHEIAGEIVRHPGNKVSKL